MVAFSLADNFIETAKAWSIVGVTWRDAPLLKGVGKVALAAGAAGVLTAVARAALVGAEARPFVVLVSCAAVFGAVYVAAVALLGVVKQGERDALRRHFEALQRHTPWRRVPDPTV
jgi:hypothetical protein